MDALVLTRGTIKEKLIRFQTFITKMVDVHNDAQRTISKAQILEIELRSSSINNILNEYETIHASIVSIADDNQLKAAEADYSNFESTYFAAMAQANELVMDTKDVSSAGSPTHSMRSCNSGNRHQCSRSPYYNLPKVNVPKFSGDLDNWMEFREIFKSLVHQNQDLEDIQRLHFLKGALTAEAAETIKSLEFVPANYKIAWNALCARYDQPKLLVRNHLKAILNLDFISKESAAKLRQVHDALFKHFTALQSLATEAQILETFLIHIVSAKLDPTSARQWETQNNKSGSELPTLKEFREFLTNQANLIDSLAPKEVDIRPEKSKTHSKGHSKSFVVSNNSCMLCKKDHSISRCDEFRKLSPNDRASKVRELKICFNCLAKGHFTPQCHSRFTCTTCKGKHHSLLHVDFTTTASTEQPGTSTSVQPSLETQSTSAFCSNAIQVLLPTASAKVVDSAGNFHNVRILLDSGSQSNFIRTSVSKRLNLPMHDVNVSVSGLNKASSQVRSRCDVEIRAHHGPYKLNLSCLVLDEITGIIPSFRVDHKFQIPDNIRLSDPYFNQPGEIDILIGSSAGFNLLCIGQIHLGPNQPILQKTRLGWIIAGPASTTLTSQTHCHFISANEVPDQLTRFWELESYPTEKVFTPEENFVQHTRRDSEGRFVVSIPFKQPIELLGDSHMIAQKRFRSLEKRLQANPELQTRYSNFMKEYEDLSHMSLVNPTTDAITYYLPHHGVLKEDSLTTKLRVVFNGSATTTSGHSLNSIQMVGPTIQQDLFSIVVRFRQHQYTISADVEKMYRQIQVEPAQRSLQRILWRSSLEDQLQTYELNTVTYGTTSAPFLAIRCLFQLGIDCEISKPEISRIIKEDFYVDDLLTGADDLAQAHAICSNLINVLGTACFKLRKWVSNNPDVLSGISETDIHPGVLQLGTHELASTLGLTWSFHNDQLLYSISEPKLEKVTKRVILSQIAQIFDPLGLLAPCTISAKILLQQLWMEKLSWDDVVPINVQAKWISYRNELVGLNGLRIPRQAVCQTPIDTQLHGFCDASIHGYGGCIYLRSTNSENHVQVHLLCAKSKVAPLKPLTIPKLELCGAVLLSKLSQQVQKALKLQVSKCVMWSDSTIVLGWLKTNPNRLKTFVCNRVADVQQLTAHAKWRHVPTKCNPADLLSRGVTPQELKDSSLWWNAPIWLRDDENSWPNLKVNPTELPEVKKEVQCMIIKNQTSFLFNDFSNMTRLERVTAYCLRFRRNSCRPKNERSLGPLTPTELHAALDALIRIAQIESFVEELKQLQQAKPLKSSSPLIRFNPFLDSEGLIRVGGRLQNSQFSYMKKHPVLISGKHSLAKLIVAREHIRLLHAGPQLLLASLRNKFWITSARNLVKLIVHSCVKCFRFSPKVTQPIMGDLPSVRVQPSPPFHVTGIDYAGLLMIRDRKGRGSKMSKAYLCLYICFTTKAVHLELVTDLSTKAFLLSLRRFVSRRGKPLHVYSDNGSNFVGANSELKELGKFLKSQELSLSEMIASEGIHWHFIPAHSPHFGGLWEAGVKSCKYHLKRVLGSSILTYEELCTLLHQIEATLNSRPLSPLSTDPNDHQPLTPAHFLIGRPLTSIPDPDVTDIPESRLSKYQRIQQLHQNLWKRWSKEYLTELQQRCKWQVNRSELHLSSLVLIKEENAPPLHWKLGRVIQLHPGKDGVTRVATIRTSTGTVRRSFSKLCPLPVEPSA